MNARVWRVRPAVAALPGALLVTLLCRSLAHGVGADELSLLTMGQSIHAGFLPYEEYWDVRPPLGYLWALPSAYVDDATRAIVMLRLLAWLAQALAAWICFCLFRKTLGTVAAALGAFGLVLAANATQLHMMAMPNHFSMMLSVAAFACLVAGRRGRPVVFVCSGLLAGLLPWVMTQAALVLLSLGLVALCSPARPWRERMLWLAAAALPALATFGTYLAWGPSRPSCVRYSRPPSACWTCAQAVAIGCSAAPSCCASAPIRRGSSAKRRFWWPGWPACRVRRGRRRLPRRCA